MLMPGRKYPAAGGLYRYGFNGKENDNEVKGEGNQQDYGMRIYDPRLVKFLSVDPLTKSYPFYTPYSFSGNKPIISIDLDGLEEYIVITSLHKDGGRTISIQCTNINGTKKKVNMAFKQLMKDNSLGSPLTDYKIVRIVQTENGDTKSVNFGNELSKDESSILNSATKDPPSSAKLWKIVVDGKEYESEAKRDPSTQTDITAEKTIKPYRIHDKNLNTDVGGSFLMGTGAGDDVKLVPGAEKNKLLQLPSEIKKDNSITSVDITIVFPYVPTSDNENINKARSRAYNAGKLVKSILLGSGLKSDSIRIMTGAAPVDEKKNKAEVKLNRKN
jgi:RHS repeat-associated protein